jgi:outer membrane receptor protein involved in Fe transport
MLKGNQALLARAPMLDANFKGRVRIIEGLYAHTDMRFTIFTPVEGYTPEKAIINISLGARYAINERLSAFLDGHNLLNRHHQYFAGYPSQGISVMAGAAFKF